jgi:hypothetical protein
MRTGFWSRISILFQILLAISTELAGLVAFVYFSMQHNYQASAWGFFSAFFALVAIHLHILFLRNDLDDWYEPSSFEPMKYLAATFLVAGLVSVAFNLFLAIQNQEGTSSFVKHFKHSRLTFNPFSGQCSFGLQLSLSGRHCRFNLFRLVYDHRHLFTKVQAIRSNVSANFAKSSILKALFSSYNFLHSIHFFCINLFALKSSWFVSSFIAHNRDRMRIRDVIK